jgi:hypothetical protein
LSCNYIETLKVIERKKIANALIIDHRLEL